MGKASHTIIFCDLKPEKEREGFLLHLDKLVNEGWEIVFVYQNETAWMYILLVKEFV